jgi:hypothetical protein
MYRSVKPKKSKGIDFVLIFILYISELDDDKRNREVDNPNDSDLPDEIKYREYLSFYGVHFERI